MFPIRKDIEACPYVVRKGPPDHSLGGGPKEGWGKGQQAWKMVACPKTLWPGRWGRKRLGGGVCGHIRDNGSPGQKGKQGGGRGWTLGNDGARTHFEKRR